MDRDAALLFTATLLWYAAETSHHNVLEDIQTPADDSFSLLDQANLVEVIAESVWGVVMQEDVGLPDTATVYFVARPFDDGEPRLVICNDTVVVANMIWPARGSLDEWIDAVTKLASTLRAFAAGLHPDPTPLAQPG